MKGSTGTVVPDSVAQGSVALFLEYNESLTVRNVVLFDLASRRKYYVTQDDYLKDSPILSKDRRSVVFVSARLGEPRVLKAMGESVRRQIYSLSLADGVISRFDSSLQDETSRGAFLLSSIDWSIDQQHLLCARVSNDIEEISPGSERYSTLASLPQGCNIHHIVLSPNGKLLACEYSSFDTEFTEGITIFNLKEHTNIVVTKGRLSCWLGGWSDDNEEFVYGSGAVADTSPVIFNMRTRESEILRIPGEDDSLFVEGACFLNANVLLLTAAHKNPNPEDLTRGKGGDLAIFNTQTRAFEWLTLDWRDKDALRFYSRHSQRSN